MLTVRLFSRDHARTRGARDRKFSQIDDELERYASFGLRLRALWCSCLPALCGGRRQLY
jgi:hypothetical protein